MNKPDFKNMSEDYLRANLPSYRKEVLDELAEREQKKEIREQRNHKIQLIIMVLSILIFIFTAITFFSPFFIDKNKTINSVSVGNPKQPQTNKTNNKPDTNNKKLEIK